MTDFSLLILQILQEGFSQKVDVPRILDLLKENHAIVDKTAQDIQKALTLYNKDLPSTQLKGVDASILLNTTHLRSIWANNLPDYQVVISQLENRPELLSEVIAELTTSDYFQEVYLLPKSEWILQNILILLYRTSLLHLHPALREKGAQISSTIEELTCVLHLSGEKSSLFATSAYWIEQWETEGFSPELAKKIQMGTIRP